MKVHIKLLVGSNGKVSASNGLDWGDLADNIMDWDTAQRTNSDPEASARYVVEVEIEIPTGPTLIQTEARLVDVGSAGRL